MIAEIRPSGLAGDILIPASKSHTIRALLIASLAPGESVVANPLDSKDARSCIQACRTLGAEISEISGGWGGYERALQVKGIGTPQAPASDIIDVGNSGTTEYLLAGIAALAPGYTVFTGDHQIRNRPVENLLAALRDLGATAFTTRGNGAAPFVVGGPITGGKTSIECPTSQFLSSLLLALPLAQGYSVVDVPLLHEQPYAEMTLRWLEEQGIRVQNDDWKRFTISGGQSYRSFEKAVPGDFSSATFFAVAAAITGSSLVLHGLDMSDSQGDKAVFLILSQMGCRVDYLQGNALVAQTGGASGQDDAETAYAHAVQHGTDAIRIAGPSRMGRPLRGGRFDLNAIPDALPALSAAACFSVGQVELVNVPQARLKETDRIAVMTRELSKMGASITELEDGMIIRPPEAAGSAPGTPGLSGAEVQGHDDHRVVMSLAVAGLVARGTTRIHGAEAASVTYPEFFQTLDRVAGNPGTLTLL
ncbi:3-phosphoshikimate 1-carboxyvinyltransferase [Spirochaeta lutea]|uniref:3-phosphoshikimate 1-carboxyvinyltransferase n=1 Tax=Spirochaeta lutea TaxID=1480694 RepID=A0A098QZS4_9SPIO|nr:3-phosphoshikimate 1-carboxyvinyltransferase [Spirochaeta lutea]KGE71992.1 hypothetical protein DC28_09440 [Spirochaeta lutea]